MNKGRKITGGKYHSIRKKRMHEHAKSARIVLLGETKRKSVRTKGGNSKTFNLRTNEVNVLVGKKTQKAEITNVTETPQNTFFARENRLMKGAIIETSLGKAKITNRPSQEGRVNAILLQK